MEYLGDEQFPGANYIFPGQELNELMNEKEREIVHIKPLYFSNAAFFLDIKYDLLFV